MFLTIMSVAILAGQDPEAETPPPPRPVIRPASWARPISYEAQSRAFRDFHERVEVHFLCGVGADGSLVDCSVRSASPERAGPIALPLTRSGRIKMTVVPGEPSPAGSRIAFSIRWWPED